jgi:hypothetical protein
MRLAAGAATAGIAYSAGKRHAQQQAVNEEAEAAYSATQGATPPQPAPAPAPAAGAAPAGAESMTDELTRLAKLHEAGVLTDDEFAAAKAKLLG